MSQKAKHIQPHVHSTWLSPSRVLFQSKLSITQRGTSSLSVSTPHYVKLSPSVVLFTATDQNLLTYQKSTINILPHSGGRLMGSTCITRSRRQMDPIPWPYSIRNGKTVTLSERSCRYPRDLCVDNSLEASER